MLPPKTYHLRQYDTETHNRLTDRNLRRGGNFITQSYPTNFHEFATRKILTSGDSVDNYREVTAAERATIERADAKWEKPGDWLIEQAEANGAVYNAATGYFELNGLVDITAEQMNRILQDSAGTPFLNAYAFAKSMARTFVPIKTSNGSFGNDTTRAFYGCNNLEVIAFESSVYVSTGEAMFTGCTKLREIRNGVLVVYANIFNQLPSLEEVSVRARASLSFERSANLSTQSIEFLVERAENTAPITISLHPNVYARVTDELFTAAATKNITIATTA